MHSDLLVMTKRTTPLLSFIAIATLALSFILPAFPVAAQSAATGQALEIGPPVLNLTANPGDTVKATISLRDISSGSLIVKGTLNDFVAGGEDGTPKILLDSDEVSPYSFKEWASPIPDLTLKSKEIKNLAITINVPKNASPGGYYGVVRFTGTPPDLEDTGVSLAASVGSLILLKVNGEIKEGLAIEEFTASHDGKTGTLFEFAPIVFTERIKNIGNVHEEPAGLVTVKDMFGNVVATLGVNQPPRDVLPQSIRKFESSLDGTNIGDKVLFGLYTAELSINYGPDTPAVTSTISFWVIPYTLIGIGIIALVAGFFGLRFLIRRYNQSVIKRAQKANEKKQ